MLYKDSVKSWFIRRVWRWCWECDRHPFLLFQITQKNMEHFRIVKAKFSNKKTTTFADGDFRAFAVFRCNFIQNMLSAKSLCARNFSKLVIRESFCPQNDKKFSKFSTYLSYFFKNFPNCLLCVGTLESPMF